MLLAPWWMPQVFQECKHTKAQQYACVAVASTFLCFFFSALFHNVKWTHAAFVFVQKLDHTGIFFMIGGSVLPIQLHFRGLFATVGLFLACSIIVLGALLTLTGALADDAPDLEYLTEQSLKLQDGDKDSSEAQLRRSRRALVYLGMGFSHLVMVPEILQVLTAFEGILLLLTAVCYTSGAAMYKNQWPNPVPGVFGFHECFHLLCAVAALCSMLLNISALRRSEIGLA